MTDYKAKVSVLFVCMGNICRSPTAHGIFQKLVEDAGLADVVRVDSAGTHAYHTGAPPDRRAQAAAEHRGYALHDLRARPVVEDDFLQFDYIIAMDEDNLSLLQEQATADSVSDIRLFLEFSDCHETEVPDPYYGGSAGFERVLDLVEVAARDLLEHIKAKQKS